MIRVVFGTLFLIVITTPMLSFAAEVINFGCPAYLIGGTPNLSELKKKGVTSMVIDSSSSISASQAQAAGIIPIYYVNAFCQPDKFKCDGPRMTGSSVSGAFGEVIPQPQSRFFFENFSAQTQQVQKLGGTIIEIDNMDEYVRRGEVNAIKYLIESAGKAGINVVLKNEANATLVALSNVVGVIVEPGSEGGGYRAAFTAAGKPTAGVLAINGSAGDAHTSVSTVNHSGKGQTEYTEFYGCSSNAAGPRAPTPPTNYQITPPSSLLSQQPQQPLTNLQRSLMPLAQPLMQQSPLTIPQQTSSIQPSQYFSPQQTAPASSGTSLGTAPQPSVAESLLRSIRPVQDNKEPVSPVTLVRASTSTLIPPVRTENDQNNGTTAGSGSQTQPSTFVSSDLQHAPTAQQAEGAVSTLLKEIAGFLRTMLDFLRGR